ncbi:SgcJ/EcaC family oxidoreductase [Micromonospora sp. U21]|uniref:SgcJ/EcaC family oxidoreductase n=1 Tax=Micromonospora sp. U21 TaxID=2824899 RepID=UPI001B37E3ED|nr:SgcJ/EcaC family oxidoreductase [Micromonospora sp. U21]MBQ0901991.1 SgcJ/EcaC family oxidoreductase [Micromonospora sp. U21]
MTKSSHWRRTTVAVSVAVTAAVALLGSVPSAASPSASADQAQASATHQADLTALRHLREKQEDAWARGDGSAYAAIHTADADVVTFNGDHLRTRHGIATGMQHYFDEFLQGTRIMTLTEQTRFSEPDIAIIVRTGCVLWPGESTCSAEALSINTNIALKRHGKWLYTSFQNTRIRPLS